jgi:hypothetical protein
MKDYTTVQNGKHPLDLKVNFYLVCGLHVHQQECFFLVCETFYVRY